MASRLWHRAGFSLLEIMVVMSIIGIFLVLGMPRYKSYKIQAARSEAKVNLSSIYTLEQTYFSERERYVSVSVYDNSTCSGHVNELGFRITSCGRLFYGYEVDTPTFITYDATAASATGANHPFYTNCADADIFAINQNREFTHPQDASATCE